MKPQSKLWKQIPQQAAGCYTLRFAGLFNLPIPLRFAFGIGVSRIILCSAQNVKANIAMVFINAPIAVLILLLKYRRNQRMKLVMSISLKSIPRISKAI
jgi:hypothetical protein